MRYTLRLLTLFCMIGLFVRFQALVELFLRLPETHDVNRFRIEIKPDALPYDRFARGVDKPFVAGIVIAGYLVMDAAEQLRIDAYLQLSVLNRRNLQVFRTDDDFDRFVRIQPAVYAFVGAAGKFDGIVFFHAARHDVRFPDEVRYKPVD